jgi:hypothetical protein
MDDRLVELGWMGKYPSRAAGSKNSLLQVTVVPGVQQGSTNFLISALEIQYPDAEVLGKGYFAWILTSIGMLFAMAPNIVNQEVLRWYFRFAIVIFHILLILYWIWFPIKASQTGGFQSGKTVGDPIYFVF